MKKLLSLGMAGALLVVASAAFAYPTLVGPTGVVGTSTADVAPAGQFTVAADWYDTEGDSSIPVRLVYGIANNFEVGALYNFDKARFGGVVDTGEGAIPFTAETDNTWGINAKYMTPWKPAGADLALGALYTKTSFDVTTDTTPVLDLNGDENVTEVYLAASKSFATAEETGTSFRGTLGINWTHVKASISDDVEEESMSDSAFRGYINLEAIFSNKLALAAEFQTKSSDLESDAISSIVARYPFTPALTGEVGFTNAIGVLGTNDHNVFAGIAYTFGGAAAEE